VGGTLDLEIRTVKVDLVRPLRREVLRQGQPHEASVYEGDDDYLTVHLAAFDPDGEIVGIATLCKPEDRVAGQPPYPKPGLRFRGLAVRPDLARQGVGTQIVRQLRELAREREARELWANARVTALPFFLARKFKVVSSPFEVPGIGTHVVIADAP
jgi:GNAT superfamily N-acetyltransferase